MTKPNSPPKAKKTPKKTTTRKETSDFTRKFRYVGNIDHIKAYIDKNTGADGVMVELYIRPLTKIEREIYAVPSPSRAQFELSSGSSKNQRTARIASTSGRNRNGIAVEEKPCRISRADLSKWKLNLQRLT